MCFSANASFVSSGVLALAGIASLSKVSNRSQILFASIPLIFSIQQFAEGVLWQCMNSSEANLCTEISSYAFVILGQSLWPVWIPLSMLLLEPFESRKNLLKVFLVVGIIISAYLLFRTMKFGVKPQILNHNIHYTFQNPSSLIDSLGLVYLVPTVLAVFVSSIKEIKILSVVILFSFIITKIMFAHAVFSVWCFFAATISLFVFIILRSQQKRAEDFCLGQAP